MIEQTIVELLTPRQAIFCASCAAPLAAIEIAQAGYGCPACGAPVCVMCGCTQERACAGGCAWMAPGICSAHEGTLRAEVARVFPEVSL